MQTRVWTGTAGRTLGSHMSQTGREGRRALPLTAESAEAVRGVLPLVDTSAAASRDGLPEVLVGLAVDLVGVEEAVVVLVADRGRVEVAACSSEEVGRLCKPGVVGPQGGPGGEAACTGRAVLLESPGCIRPGHLGFARAAGELGFGLVHALPLGCGPSTVGSLVVFGVAASALCRPERRMLQALVQVAAAGLHHQQALRSAGDRIGQLEQALGSRVVIEQAKGALLARGAADLAGAFHQLRVHARSHHLRLEDVAREVVGRAAHHGPALLPPPLPPEP